MEGTIQLSYSDYKASYRITSLNLAFYYAELVGFSGIQEDRPPLLIYFIYDHGKAIASSDVINIARDLIKQMNHKNSFAAQSYYL